MTTQYPVVKNRPVARFYYQGTNHSHPVRRTVLVIEADSNLITGYELRNGSKTVTIENAPIKSFSRTKIPAWGDYQRLRRFGNDPGRSTLTRWSMANLDRLGA